MANGRHQRTEWGRLDHRDRQRAYRRRKAIAFSVTDQGSETRVAVFTLLPPSLLLLDRCEGEVVCRVCGRRGTLIDPFTG